MRSAGRLRPAASVDNGSTDATAVRWEFAAAVLTLVVAGFATSVIRNGVDELDRRVGARQPRIDELVALRAELRRAGRDGTGDSTELAASRLAEADWDDLFPGRAVVLRQREDAWVLVLEPSGGAPHTERFGSTGRSEGALPR
ncbi:MAG: hypothetical protein R3F56_11120 [Planctomycetota bacterium]